MGHLRRLSIVLLVALAAGALLYGPASRHWRSAEFLSRLSAALASDAAASEGRPQLIETELAIGDIKARLYQPADRRRGPGVVVAHGVHYQGIDEHRLMTFARALSRSGVTVLTPEIEDLTHYRVTPQGTAVIGRAVRYLASQSSRIKGSRVGVVGFSFAGGLSLVAATDPGTSQHLSYVASVGGHHDLGRVMRFLVQNQVATPAGMEKRQAHEYGLLVAVYEYLDRLVPEEDLPAVREALRAWLEEDRDRARVFASQRSTARGEEIFELLETQQLSQLRPKLEAILAGQEARLRALSPRGRLGEVGVPIYLLHGTGDTVIPPSEAEWASLELGDRHHELLVTPLIEHVAVKEDPDWQQQVELVRFMSRIL